MVEGSQASGRYQASQDLVPLLLDYLDGVAARTADRLGPIGGVAVTLGSQTDPITVGSSSALAYEVDKLQYSIGTGPCLHALGTGEGLYVADLAHDDRWQDYGPRAAKLGAASCVSLPVLVGPRVEGVVKAYGKQIDGISHDQRDLLSAVAMEISGGIALARRLTTQAKELDDRTMAMDSRRVIDLALGMLMERTSCGPDAAFALLRRYSQHYNVKVRDAAKQIVGVNLGDVPHLDQAPYKVHREG